MRWVIPGIGRQPVASGSQPADKVVAFKVCTGGTYISRAYWCCLLDEVRIWRYNVMFVYTRIMRVCIGGTLGRGPWPYWPNQRACAAGQRTSHTIYYGTVQPVHRTTRLKVQMAIALGMDTIIYYFGSRSWPWPIERMRRSDGQVDAKSDAERDYSDSSKHSLYNLPINDDKYHELYIIYLC